MKSQMKQKILMIGIVAVFAFITTIGATYAWFTIGGSTDIQSIQLTVNSSTSLLIRMDDPDIPILEREAFYNDPGNYVSTLDTTTILAAYNYANIRFRPVTTLNGTTITYRDPNASLQPSSSVLTEGAGQYIEFKVWVMSQAADVDVVIKDYTITASNLNVNKNDIINAIRISYTASSTTLIYGIDKDYDFEFKVNDVGYDSTPESTENTFTPPSTLTDLHGLFYKASGAVVNESTSTMSEASTLMTLEADVPTQVTIRIWIEGWDSNADNNIVSANFAISFIFAVKEIII